MNKQLFNKLLFCLTFSLISGCAARVDMINYGPTYSAWDGNVKVYNEKPTDIKYEEIGKVIVEARSGEFNSSWGEMTQLLTKKSKEIGANGVIMDKESSTTLGAGSCLAHNTYEVRRLSGIAIRIKE